MREADELMEKIKNKEWGKIDDDDVLIGMNVCPECNAKLENIAGCKECECGFTVCG